ncbi:hypothetical protein ACFPL7_16695 [Dongia soli]|uniref:Uncharacterized protein n=1 Tax=Dongia soli TaxID=600628 RepID=A0ABU5E656_9PROT|nr:hypothetical protein [Dongia soli]MDY0881229.1 hypothetical protein [Dongia soli]
MSRSDARSAWLRRCRLVSHSLVLLSLAGCDSSVFPWLPVEPMPAQQASKAGEPSVTRGKPASSPSTTRTKATKPKAKKQTTSNPAAAAPSEPATPEPTEEAPPPPAAGQPNDMIGQNEAGIRSLVGDPATTRNEGSTTVWSYRKEGCALDLFLFYDVKTGERRVLTYEIKPESTDNNAIQVCYDKFRNV